MNIQTNPTTVVDTFDDKKEKYNLEPKLFESYRLVLQAKSERCSLKSILDISNDNQKVIDLITQHTLLTAKNVTDAADGIWSDFDPIDAIGGMQTSNVKATPAEYKQILHKDLVWSSVQTKLEL